MSNNKNELRPVEGEGSGVYEFAYEPTNFDIWKAGVHIKLNMLLRGQFNLLRMMNIGSQFSSGKLTKEQAQEKIAQI